MAVSAFRSTTRRTSIGPGGDGAPGTPSTPAYEGRLRRANSHSDFSSKYLSDSSSTTDAHAGHHDGTSSRRGRSASRRPSTDFESDVDGSYKRYMRPRRSSSRDVAQCGSISDGATSFSGARRSSSQGPRRGRLFPEKDISGDEMQVEERTIRAVHAQMKQLRSKHPTGDIDATSLYDAMRSEVRRAVAELKQEIHQSTNFGESLDSVYSGDEQAQSVADMRRQYSTKLELSEKRAQDLWSELAEEEQRCLDLAKLVKELLPDPNTRPSQRSSRTKRVAKQIMSQSLDDEARRYFEECVSVSKIDSTDGDEDTSVSQLSDKELSSELTLVVSAEDKEASLVSRKSSPVLFTKADKVIEKRNGESLSDRTSEDNISKAMLTNGEGSQTSTEQIETLKLESPQEETLDSSLGMDLNNQVVHHWKAKKVPVNDDGIVMPWVNWETEADTSPTRKVKKRIVGSSKKTKAHHEEGKDVSSKMSSTSRSSLSSTSSSIHEARNNKHALDFATYLELIKSLLNSTQTSKSSTSEEHVLHRMRFNHRIGAGSIHLCGGKF